MSMRNHYHHHKSSETRSYLKNGFLFQQRPYLFHEGLALIEINNKWGYINKDGVVVIEPQFDDALHFSEGLACVKINNKWGFIDNRGTIVIYPKFDDPGSFKQGLATVKFHGTENFINKKGILLSHALELRTVDHPEYWYG